MMRRVGPVGRLATIAIALLNGCRSETDRSAQAQTVATAEVRAPDARRVWTGDHLEFYASSVSADGRYVTMIDWASLDLAVQNVLTGTFHRITHHTMPPFQQVHTSVFSRDGRQIAYSWATQDTRQASSNLKPYAVDVRLIDFEIDDDGVPHEAPPRIIYQNPLKQPFYLWDWSPDGTLIVGKQYGPDNTVELVLVSSDGSAARTLKSFDWREPLRAAFSPDGRYVAYDLPSDVDPRERNIFALAVDGSREHRIIDERGYHRLFGWSPQNDILFTTRRDGAPAPTLSRQRMSDGVPVGKPALLRRDFWRAEPIGYADHAFYYGVAAEVPTLHLVDLDLDAGRPANAPWSIVDDGDGVAQSWAWSLDGEHLAILIRDPAQRGRRLVVRSADGTFISELDSELEPYGRLHWAPDGTSVMVFGPDERGRLGFYRIDLETGTGQAVLRTEDLEVGYGFYDLSPDGETIYFAVSDGATGGRSIISRDLVTGEERIVGRTNYQGLVALSPNGTQLATVAPQTDSGLVALELISTNGEPPREVFRIFGNWVISSLNWTPTGDALLFVVGPHDESTTDLWLVPVDGGEARKVEGISPYFRSVALHPNGRRLAYRTGGYRGEIWTLAEASATSRDASGSR